MDTISSFSKSTLTIEKWYAPKSKMCANCEFVSDKENLFIETVQGITLCVYCDEKGLFICDEHKTVHTHEAGCVITSPTDFSTASVIRKQIRSKSLITFTTRKKRFCRPAQSVRNVTTC